MTGGKKIRVLVIDDSAVVRQTMSELINQHPEMEVIATAGDPFQAAECLRKNVPDVITLDVEMPRMDGITFLRKLMSQRPIPVVMCSSLVGAGTKTLMAALDAGAVDVVQKPVVSTKKFLEESAITIQDKILAAYKSKLGLRKLSAPTKSQTSSSAKPTPDRRAMYKTTQTVIAIGASTGGTEALRFLLKQMPPFAPPILVVQHMPEHFTKAFAERLDAECDISVREARDGDSALRGQALIAPGSRHMALRRSGANYGVSIIDGPLVNRHRPSVDVLFRSAARNAGGNSVGVILTGMGNDGASWPQRNARRWRVYDRAR